MADKITYGDKSHVLPYGTREIQVWDLDMNEIKTVVNINADEVDDLKNNQYTGVEVYTTIADLPITGVALVSYKVSNDTISSNNGYYHWNGSAYVKDASLNLGEVVDGNTDAVEGGKIYDYISLASVISHTRTPLSISGADVTVGDGFFYTVFEDKVEKEKLHVSNVYTIQSGGSLVHNKQTNSLLTRSSTSVIEGDAILLKYDSVKGIVGGLWFAKYIDDRAVLNPSNISQAINYHALHSTSRASISINGSNITLGDGFIYVLFKDGTTGERNHTETTYNMATGDAIVFKKSNNVISQKTKSTLLEDDAVLFWYDGIKGVQSGLLMPQYLNEKINSSILPVTKNLLNSTVKGTAHRGFSSVAPENTLPSYKLAKEKGFAYVECDISWSSDNVPVLLHDSTVDRTSNGTGLVESLTLAELKTLDFGVWKSAEYTGTTIPTFEEFMFYCKQLNLYPYVEPKAGISGARATILIDIAIKTGMINNMTWLSFDLSSLNLILASQPTARVGYTMSVLNNTVITEAINIKTAINKVFLDAGWSSITSLLVETALIGDIPVEAWTVDNSLDIIPLVQKGVSGITTNSLNIEDVLNS